MFDLTSNKKEKEENAKRLEIINSLTSSELEDLYFEKKQEQLSSLFKPLSEEEVEEIKLACDVTWVHRYDTSSLEVKTGFFGDKDAYPGRRDVFKKSDLFGPKTAPDIFTYLKYMIEQFNITQFTVVPYLPTKYEEDGTVIDEEVMPAPHIFNCYNQGYNNPDWQQDLNNWMREFDWNILEVGLNSLVMTTEGPRHLLMYDMDGRGFKSTGGDEILNQFLGYLIRDNQLDPLKTMVLRSTKSFHVYDCARLYTHDEWIKMLVAGLYHDYDAHIKVDPRWIANVIYLRGYGIVRMSYRTNRYHDVPRALSIPKDMSDYFVRLVEPPVDPSVEKDDDLLF